jgi:transposase InsO family protein
LKSHASHSNGLLARVSAVIFFLRILGSRSRLTWIERTYHRRRRQRGLGRLTPIEYETINKVAQAA